MYYRSKDDCAERVDDDDFDLSEKKLLGDLRMMKEKTRYER